MNRTINDKEDQAEQLRTLFAEVEQQTDETTKEAQEVNETTGVKEEDKAEETIDELSTNNGSETTERESIDILNLPPRKEIHGDKKGKFHFKIGRPLIRLLIVCIIVIGLVSWFIWSKEILDFFNV
ncbi:hypothetical protein GMD78_02360 [Ornithinibacillus sp. L9]|uniref:Uncharacterized protein n=1 Tax=Ornithinibacillus caprae TaxID=2678566 RepID=A0A6N8FG48_9BACI|nr:hypothetical protein [Ornithinibacillus caprae]MUK87244.1 hypothetical protein [Ornithinibacillus caprae]